MKKIDRYVANAYILRFLMAHAVIFGLYISFDIMQRIDMFSEVGAGQTLSQVLVLYLYQLPSNVMDTVPPLLMISAGLVFVHLNREGELLTLKASGVSLRRIALPIFMVTIPVVALLAISEEVFIPDLYRQRALLENQIEQRVSGPFVIKDTQYGYELFVGEVDFNEGTISHATLMIPHDDVQMPKELLQADLAGWAEEDMLEFRRASLQRFDSGGSSRGDPEAFEQKTYPTSLSLADFIDAQHEELGARAPSMTALDLKEQMQQNPHNPRFKVLFHSRLADKLTPFALLLLGIPMLVGYGANHHSRLVGALVTIILMGVYYLLSFIILSVGNAGLINPVAAAWIMPSLGTLTGIVMFSKMRT